MVLCHPTEYYEELLQQEEKMRRFRHDINTHIVALKTYCINGEIQNMQGYLNQIVSESAIYKVKKYTGIRSYDLCTIISNLLKNAIEACERIENISERKVLLQIAIYNSKVYIIVKNKVKEKVVMNGKCPISTEESSSFHGLGYGNIQYVVSKYNGTLECRTEEGYFEVEVGL